MSFCDWSPFCLPGLISYYFSTWLLPLQIFSLFLKKAGHTLTSGPLLSSGTHEYNKYFNFIVLSKYNFHGHLGAILKDPMRKTYSFINTYIKNTFMCIHIDREREKNINQLIKNYSKHAALDLNYNLMIILTILF